MLGEGKNAEDALAAFDDFATPDCPRWMISGRGDQPDLAGRLHDIASRQESGHRVPTHDEYGNTTTADAVDGTLGYGWLGAKQRATSAATAGLTLMGVRLYNAARGLFTSLDPIPEVTSLPSRSRC